MNERNPIPEQTKHRGNRWLIVGVVLLVAIPVCLTGFSGEVDRWRAARAMETWLDGDKLQAVAELRAVQESIPDDYGVRLTLSQWLLDLGATNPDQQQADEALELIQNVPDAKRDEKFEIQIQHCLLAQGKKKEALEAYRKANPANAARTGMDELQHRNALSYFQALAAEDLELAYRNSDWVVGSIESEWNSNPRRVRLTAHLQAQFCTAFVYRSQISRFEQGSEESESFAKKAIRSLSQGLEFLDIEFKRNSSIEERLEKSLELWAEPPNDDNAKKELKTGRQKGKTASPNQQRPEEEQAPDLKPEATKQSNLSDELKVARGNKEDIAHAIASLLTLRAMVYQDIGDDELSFADRKQVLKIGIDPENLVEQMPGFSDCVHHLSLLAMSLDTRGCVLYHLSENSEALKDLDLAVDAQQALVDVAGFVPRTRQQSSLDPRQQHALYIRAPQRMLAALLLHRSWVNQAANDFERIQNDLARIRKLGFVPGNYLF